jgi:hypothetical protein
MRTFDPRSGGILELKCLGRLPLPRGLQCLMRYGNDSPENGPLAIGPVFFKGWSAPY